MECSICGITDQDTRIINSKKYGCLCRKHYLRAYKGKNIDRSIYDPNDYIIYESYAEIILRDKNCEECGRAIIDLEDVEKCKQFKWHIRRAPNTNYAVSSEYPKRRFLHQLIMNYYDLDMDIDHINRNGLDNRKSNLRIISHSKNITNQGRGTGVKQVPSGNFQAIITKDAKPIYLGTFNSFDEACDARKIAEELYF